MKKVFILAIILLVSIFLFSACACKHENLSQATCTTPVTCLDCGEIMDSELAHHVGTQKCTVCGAKFDVLWKEFVSGYGEDDQIGFSGDIGVLLTYTEEDDCVLYAMAPTNIGSAGGSRTLTMTYNAYDQEWLWYYSFADDLGYAYGTFSKWSSRSGSLSFSYKNDIMDILFTDSEFLTDFKFLYNTILSDANAKLSECGMNFSMENLGLGN